MREKKEKPLLTFEAESSQQLQDTPVPSRFGIVLNELQEDHWSMGLSILITNLHPNTLGSEEVTFGKCALGWVCFYPTPQLTSVQFLDRVLKREQSGAFYLLVEPLSEVTHPVRSAKLCFLTDHV